MKKEDKSNLVDEAEEHDTANGSTYSPEEKASPASKSLSPRTCCKWKLEGLALVILVVVVFSLAITIAMIIHILVGPPQVIPHGAAASSSSLCAKAATDVMKKGANGVDGAVAAALCESVTLGHATGLGGGALIYVYSQSNTNSTLFDCREAAPASSSADMFKGAADKATAGGLSVAVPGFLRCLHEAHKKFGSVSWESLFVPAIHIAKTGFPMPRDLHDLLTNNVKLRNLAKASPPLAKAYLLSNGTPVATGSTVKRTDLATVLETISKKGVDEFYKHSIANEIAGAVKSAGGGLQLTDLSSYEAKRPKPIRGHFNHFTVMSFPLPSIGGPMMLASLNALDSYKIYRSLLPNETSIPNQVKSPNLLYYQRLVEVMRSTLNTANSFGGGNGVNQTQDFLSPTAAKALAKSIAANSTAPLTGNVMAPIFALPAGDSQLAVQGPRDYLVALSSCLGSIFGSGVTTSSGILLNNAMGAFALPDVTPVNKANLPAKSRRPITPLAPFVAFNPRRRCGVRFAGGSCGGLSAPQAEVQLAMAALLWDVPSCREKDCVNLPKAVVRPRLGVQPNSKVVKVEPGIGADVGSHLSTTGHTVERTNAVGDVQVTGEVQHIVKVAADHRQKGGISSF